MTDKNKGIGSIIPQPLTPAEQKSVELKQWAVKNIDRGDWRSRQKENEMRTVSEDDTLDYIPSINISPPKTSEEPRNKSGHTEAQKSRIAHQWTVRPPDNIKKIVKKNMPILTYIDKVSNVYDGKPRQYDDQGKPLNNDKTIKQLTALKEFGKNPYTYKSKLETLVEPKQLSMDFGTDQYGNIPGPTDRIQDQARQKEIEIRNKNRARNATKEKTDV